MAFLLKFVAALLLLVLVLTCAVLLALRLNPDLLISAANSIQDAATVEANELNVALYPPGIEAQSVQVAMDTAVISTGALTGSLSPAAWWRDEPFWSADVDALSVSQTADASAETTETAEPSTPPSFDFERWMTFETVRLRNSELPGLVIHDATLSRSADDVDLSITLTAQGRRVQTNGQLSAPHPHAFDLVATVDNPDVRAELKGRLDENTVHLADSTVASEGVTLNVAQADVAIADVVSLSADTQILAPSGYAHPLGVTLRALIQPEGPRVTLEEATLKSPDVDANVSGELLSTAPVDLTLKVAAKHLSLPGGLVSADETQVSAAPDSEPEINAAAADETEAPEDTAADSGRLLSDQPIDFTWMADTRVNVEATVATLNLNAAAFQNFGANIRLDNNTLHLDDFEASLGSGGFAGNAHLQAAGDEAAASLHFSLRDVELEEFEFLPQDQLSGGLTAIDINLQTQGHSLSTFAAAAAGDVQAVVENATLQNDLIELVGSDLVLEALEKLNPFAKSDPTTELECALVRFDLADTLAVSDNALVVETTKMEIVGDGRIDLKDESLDITFSPTSKAGLGVNVGGLVKFLKLGGTLAQPGLEFDALGGLKTGVAVGAAISTGGASLLAEGLAKRVVSATGSACDAARGASPQRTAE